MLDHLNVFLLVHTFLLEQLFKCQQLLCSNERHSNGVICSPDTQFATLFRYSQIVGHLINFTLFFLNCQFTAQQHSWVDSMV